MGWPAVVLASYRRGQGWNFPCQIPNTRIVLHPPGRNASKCQQQGVWSGTCLGFRLCVQSMNDPVLSSGIARGWSEGFDDLLRECKIALLLLIRGVVLRHIFCFFVFCL